MIQHGNSLAYLAYQNQDKLIHMSLDEFWRTHEGGSDRSDGITKYPEWKARTYPSDLTHVSLEVKRTRFCLAVDDPVQKSKSSVLRM
jgi:hypothetical protein